MIVKITHLLSCFNVTTQHAAVFLLKFLLKTGQPLIFFCLGQKMRREAWSYLLVDWFASIWSAIFLSWCVTWCTGTAHFFLFFSNVASTIVVRSLWYFGSKQCTKEESHWCLALSNLLFAFVYAIPLLIEIFWQH